MPGDFMNALRGGFGSVMQGAGNVLGGIGQGLGRIDPMTAGIIGSNLLAANQPTPQHIGGMTRLGMGMQNAMPQLQQMRSQKQEREQQDHIFKQRQKILQQSLSNLDVDGDGNISPQERQRGTLIRSAMADPLGPMFDQAIMSGIQMSAPLAPPNQKANIMPGPQGVPRHISGPQAGQPVFPNVQPGEASRDTEKVYTQEGRLRSEFQKITGEFRKQEGAYGRILASAEKPSAAGDLALIFNYMKLLDPGSVVRESEFATAEATGAVMDRYQNLYRKVLAGTRLTPTQRRDFAMRSKKLYDQASSGYTARQQEYRDLAGRYQGVDPARVILHELQFSEDDFSKVMAEEPPPLPPHPDAVIVEDSNGNKAWEMPDGTYQAID